MYMDTDMKKFISVYIILFNRLKFYYYKSKESFCINFSSDSFSPTCSINFFPYKT